MGFCCASNQHDDNQKWIDYNRFAEIFISSSFKLVVNPPHTIQVLKEKSIELEFH